MHGPDRPGGVGRIAGGFLLEALRHWTNGNALDLFQALVWDLQANGNFGSDKFHPDL